MSKILWEGHAPPLTPPSPVPIRGLDFEPPPLQIAGYATERMQSNTHQARLIDRPLVSCHDSTQQVIDSHNCCSNYEVGFQQGLQLNNEQTKVVVDVGNTKDMWQTERYFQNENEKENKNKKSFLIKTTQQGK